MMNKIREYMSRPYSKGDYANGIVFVCLLYTIIGAIWLIAKKAGVVTTFTGTIKRKDGGEYEIEGEEA